MAKKTPPATPDELSQNMGVDPEYYKNLLNTGEETPKEVDISRSSAKTEFQGINPDDYKGNWSTNSPYSDPTGLKPEVWRGTEFLNEAMAQNQGTWNKIWKTPLRIVGKAGTEALKTPGYLGGLVGWATTGFDDKQFGDYLDNAWVQAFSSLDQSIKDQLPIHRTKAAMEAGITSQLTDPGFWATEGADGVGFLIGMLWPGAVLKGIGAGAKISKLAGKGVKFANTVDDFGATVINTATEAAAEGVEAYNKVYGDLIAKGYSEEEAKKKAGEAGASTFYTNSVLLTVPNYLTQKWLFKSFNESKSLLNDLIDDGGKLISKEAKKSTIARLGNVGTSIGKGILSEGLFEEGMQYATSKYFEGVAKGENEFSSNPLVGILQSYMDSWDELDFQKSILLGGILGGGMSAFGSFREAKAKDELLNGTSAYTPKNFLSRSLFNAKEASPGLRQIYQENFINRYKGLDKILKADGTIDPVKKQEWIAEQVKNGTIEGIMNAAALTGNKFHYNFLKNITDFNYMLPYLQQTGGLEVLKGHINDLAQSEFNSRKAVLGDQAQSLDEVKQELLTKAEKFQEIYSKIADRHPLSAASTFADTKGETGVEFAQHVLNGKLQSALNIDFLSKEVSNLETEISALKSDFSFKWNPVAKQDVADLEKQRDLIENVLEDNQKTIAKLNSKSGLEELFKEFSAQKSAIADEVDNNIAKNIKEGETYTDKDNVSWSVKTSADGNKLSLVSTTNTSTYHPSLKNLSRLDFYRQLKAAGFTASDASNPSNEKPKTATTVKTEVSSTIKEQQAQAKETIADPNVDTVDGGPIESSLDEEGRKRSPEMLFAGLASNQEDPRERNVRYYNFLQNVNLDNGDFKVRVVLGQSEYGDLLDDTDSEIESSYIKTYGPELGKTLLAVVVNKEGTPVDEMGKPITKEEVALKGIFAPIGIRPTGEFGSRAFGTKEEIELATKTNDAYRRQVITELSEGKTVYRPITGKSTGIPMYSKPDETGEIIPTSLEDATGSKSLKDFDFWGSTDGTVLFSDGKQRAGRAGFFFTYHKPTGNVYALKTNKLSETEINNVVNLLKRYTRGLIIENGFLIPESQSTASKVAETNKSVFTHINEIVRWTGRNLKPDNQTEIETREPRRFHFAKSEGAIPSINAGGRVFPIGVIVNDKLEFNPELEKYLKEEFLPKQYRNLITADTNTVNDFVEITKVKEDGSLETVTHSKEAGGYHNVLMKIAGTRVVPKAALPTQFKNRYLIMEPNPSLKVNTASAAETEEALKGAVSVNALFGVDPNVAESLSEEVTTLSNPEALPENPEKLKDDNISSKGGKDISSEFEEEAFRVATETPFEVQNLEQELAWLKEALPQIPVHTMSTLIKGRAWGMFSQNAIYLYQNAEKGTLYHEAFHAVFRLFLSSEERNEFYKLFPEDSKIKIEERLAEDFRLYKLGLLKETPKAEVKSLFDRLLALIQSIFEFFTGPKGVEYSERSLALFKKIDSGQFQKHSIPSVVELKDDAHRTAIGNSTTAGFTKEALSSVDYYFFTEFKNRGYSFDSLFQKGKVDLKGIYDAVKTTIENKRNGFIQELKIADEARQVKLKGAIAGLDLILDNFDNSEYSVKNLHLLELERQYNLEKVDFDAVSQDDTKETKDSAALMATESLKISAKKSASKNIRFAVGTLPELTNDGKLKLNSLGMPYTAEFGKMFNILVNKFSNTYRVEDMMVAMKPLVLKYPALTRLLNTIPIDTESYVAQELSIHDMTMITQFIQTFGKNKNHFNIATVGKEAAYNRIDIGSQRVRNKIMSNWKSSAVDYDVKEGKLVYKNPSKLNSNPASLPDAIKELEKIGIKFSALDYANLNEGSIRALINLAQSSNSDIQISTFRNATNYLLRSIKEGSALSPFAEESDGEGNYRNMQFFVELEALTSYDFVENQHFNINGERVYDNTLFNELTFILSDLNRSQTLNELYDRLPHLMSDYSANSLAISKLFNQGQRIEGKQIKFTIMDGIREQDTLNGDTFSKLKEADKLVYTINEGLNGNYVFLRASDNAVERSFDFGTPFFNVAETLQAKWLDGFLGYLEDELTFISDPRILEYNELGKANAGSGIILDMLKSTNPTLWKALVDSKSFNREVNKELTIQYKEEIKEALDTAFKDSKTKLQARLERLKILVPVGPTIENNGLSRLGSSSTKEEIDLVLTSYVINNAIANIEQTKLFTGHPQAYKNTDNFFKSMSGATGTKKIVVTDNKLNEYINKYLTRTDGKTQAVGVGHNATLRTAVFADVTVKLNKEYINSYAKHIGIKRAKMYEEINEADAQGYITLDEYREMLFRTGDWNIELEALYLKELGHSKFPDTTFYGEHKGGSVEEVLKKAKHPVVFNPLKPQYFGPMADHPDLFIPGFYKLSVIPLVPSLMTNHEGSYRGLNKLRYWMQQNQVGITVFESGNKVGTKLNNGKVQSLYNDEGSIDLSNSITQETYYKYWGIQLETGNKVKKSVVSGTQMLKHVLNTAFLKGVPRAMRFVSDYKKGTYTEASTTETVKRVEEYIKLSAKRIEIGKKELIKTLGLTQEENGDYKLNPEGIDSLFKTLKKEAISRDLPENIIQGIELLRSSVVGVDILPDSDKIENILNSIADSRTISRKRHGGAKIQGAGTMFETKVTRDYDDGTISANDLSFYQNEEGKVTQMEVYLPNFLKSFLGELNIEDIDGRLLENIIGFRIPTQGLNSIESIKIKGFLPESAGELIIMPSAITVKAGSDYDVDKMNLYLPNFEMVEGKPSYIEYTEGSEDLRAIDNRLNELMKDFVMSPDNFAQLIDPIDASWMKDLADNINPETKINNGFAALIDRTFISDVTERNLVAKALVGITALQSTNNVFAQLYNFRLAPTITILEKNKEVPMSTTVNLVGAVQDETGVSISEHTTSDGRSVSQTLSQLINAAVDAAKDPYIVRLGIRESTAGAFMFLIRSGVSVETAALFMNQPIIKAYIENQSKFESHIAEVNGFKQFKTKIVELTGAQFPGAIKPTKVFTNAELREMLSKPNNSSQKQILADFIRYQEIGKRISEAIQGTTYDTNAAKNSAELMLKLTQTASIISSGEIINYNKLFTEGGFMQSAFKTSSEILKMFKPLYISMQNDAFMSRSRQLSKFLTHKLNRKPLEDKITVLDRLKKDYTGYLIQSNFYQLGGIPQIPLAYETKRLLEVPSQVQDLKSTLKTNSFIQALSVNHDAFLSNVGITLGSHKDDLDGLTHDWRTLIETPETKMLGLDLIKLAILQSGHQGSPHSIVSLIPVEYMAEMINSASKNHATQDKELAFLERFFLNNVENETLVPVIKRQNLDRIDKTPYIYPLVAVKEVSPEYIAAYKLPKQEKEDAIAKLKQKGIPRNTGRILVYKNPAFTGNLHFLGETTRATSIWTKEYLIKTQILGQRGLKKFSKGVSIFQYGPDNIFAVKPKESPEGKIELTETLSSPVENHYNKLTEAQQKELKIRIGEDAETAFNALPESIRNKIIECL